MTTLLIDPYPNAFTLKTARQSGGRGGNIVIKHVPVLRTPAMDLALHHTIMRFFNRVPPQDVPNRVRKIDVLVLKPVRDNWWTGGGHSFAIKKMQFTVGSSQTTSRVEHNLMSVKERQELAEFLYPDRIRLDRYNGTFTNATATPLEVVVGYSVHGKLICVPKTCFELDNPVRRNGQPNTRGVPRCLLDMFLGINQPSQPNGTSIVIMRQREILNMNRRRRAPVKLSQSVKNAIFNSGNVQFAAKNRRRAAR